MQPLRNDEATDLDEAKRHTDAEYMAASRATLTTWYHEGDELAGILRDARDRQGIITEAETHRYLDDGAGRCAARPLGGGRYPVCGQWPGNDVHGITEGEARALDGNR